MSTNGQATKRKPLDDGPRDRVTVTSSAPAGIRATIPVPAADAQAPILARRKSHWGAWPYFCVVSFFVIIAFLGAVVYPHIAGRPGWYGAVIGGCEPMAFQESYDQETEDVIVANDIPEEYKQGIFAAPKTYKAWLRISPGQSTIRTDREKHARGFALKLVDVPGKKLLDDEKKTQDFLLINAPIFFTGRSKDYVKLIPNIETPWLILDFKAATYKLLALIIYVAKWLSWNDNPLVHSYYSTTPYQLGKNMAVKYKVNPCSPNYAPNPAGQGPAQMRDQMKTTLDPLIGREVCYNFYVQKRVDPCTEPIEDSTIPWGTPYIKVATIKIPKQEFMFSDQFAFCERLSYNPWHSIEEHKPLGGVNHIRKATYEASAKLRTESAGDSLIEPTGNEDFTEREKDINFDMHVVQPAGDTKHYTFSAYYMAATNLTAIPHYVTTLPPGQEFSAASFSALVLRMLVGESYKHNQVADEEGHVSDGFFKMEFDSLANNAVAYLASKVADYGRRLRAESIEGRSDIPSDMELELKSARNAILKGVVQKLTPASSKPATNTFGSTIDKLVWIFKTTTHLNISKFTDVQDYEKLFNLAFETDMPWFVADGQWKRDEIFAYQHIRGVNPTRIHRASALPEELRLNDAAKSEINKRIARLRAGAADTTLDAILKSGNLFYTETSILKGLSRVADATLYQPITLFTLTHTADPSERTLMPLAIQLDTTDQEHRFFFPPEGKDCSAKNLKDDNDCLVWIFAKMFAMSADGNIHEGHVHLGMTHLMIEPVVVAAHREFTPSHPVFRVLLPHLQGTLAINDEGRDTLISPNGLFQQVTALGLKGSLELINRAYGTFNITEYTFPNRMAKQGFKEVPFAEQYTEADPLPGYLYRDFSFMLWNAVRTYMSEVVYSVYLSDSALLQDRQLQGWAWEMNSLDFANIPSFPNQIKSRETLVDLLAVIAFTASIEHSAVNFGQFDGYGFIPNRPLTLTNPMPADTTKVDMNYILKSLSPKNDRAYQQMAITFMLSTPPANTGDNIPLDTAFEDTGVLSPNPEAFKKLIAEYRRINSDMRSVTLRYNWQYYTYLYPDLLAVSIAI